MILRATGNSRKHPRYSELISNYQVVDLRTRVRSIGGKKWYGLKKAELVTYIVVHEAAVVIANLFKKFINRSKFQTYQSSVRQGARCPISLTPVSEIEFQNAFVHEKTVFSKDVIIEYVKQSNDFLNPITRTPIYLHDVKKLGCPVVLHKYQNRVVLRKEEVGAINHLYFLEGELEAAMCALLTHVYHYSNREDFERTMISFEQTWRAMKRIDHNRTVCVLKSLRQYAERFPEKPREWGQSFLDNVLRKTR